MKALMVDNYDSFTYNVVQYFAQLDVKVETVRNDAVPFEHFKNFDFIIISPGPANPNEAGDSLKVVAYCDEHNIPLIGICLGHQCIGQYFGGEVVPFVPPMHGKVSQIKHDNKGIYQNLPNPLKATRYHSLIVRKETLPAQLIASSESEDGHIQSFYHRDKAMVGIQYHPESVLTEAGLDILKNFITEYV